MHNPNNSEKRLQFVEEIKRLHGVPFILQGRTASGLDCAGLLAYAGRQTGHEVPTQEDYTVTENYSERMMAHVAMSSKMLKDRDEWLLGDCMVFATNELLNHITHIAVLTSIEGDTIKFTHTTPRTQKVQEEILDAHWLPRLHSVWRPNWLA